MAKFIYKMQNVLAIKLKMEEQAKMEYASERIRLTQEEEKLEGLSSRKREYEEQAKKLLMANLNVMKITENNEAILRMDEFVVRQKIEVHIAEERLEKARVKLQEYMQDRKTHERLREKAFDTFIIEENARESKEIDELTSYIYGQKTKNSEV